MPSSPPRNSSATSHWPFWMSALARLDDRGPSPASGRAGRRLPSSRPGRIDRCSSAASCSRGVGSIWLGSVTGAVVVVGGVTGGGRGGRGLLDRRRTALSPSTRPAAASAGAVVVGSGRWSWSPRRPARSSSWWRHPWSSAAASARPAEVLQAPAGTAARRSGRRARGPAPGPSRPAAARDGVALAGDLGLGHAEGVDAVADDLDRLVELLVPMRRPSAPSTTDTPPCRSRPSCGLLPAIRVRRGRRRPATTMKMRGSRILRRISSPSGSGAAGPGSSDPAVAASTGGSGSVRVLDLPERRPGGPPAARRRRATRSVISSRRGRRCCRRCRRR